MQHRATGCSTMLCTKTLLPPKTPSGSVARTGFPWRGLPCLSSCSYGPVFLDRQHLCKEQTKASLFSASPSFQSALPQSAAQISAGADREGELTQVPRAETLPPSAAPNSALPSGVLWTRSVQKSQARPQHIVGLTEPQTLRL